MQQRWGLDSYNYPRALPWGSLPTSCCPKCGKPGGCRECRKEARSLLATNQQQTGTRAQLPAGLAEFVSQSGADAAIQVTQDAAAIGTDFVGGDCCVTLSVECAATTSTAACLVIVYVVDSDNTRLVWARAEKAGTPYRVHECVITTKPGAKLTLVAVNCTARARWCEVFSC